MGTHKELKVWHDSIDLTVNLYELTKSFPSDEKYSLVMQMRKCSISIVSNIAEGAARRSLKDNIRFLGIALGSLAELETQFIVSENQDYLEVNNDWESSIISIRKQIIGYIKYLEKRIVNQ